MRGAALLLLLMVVGAAGCASPGENADPSPTHNNDEPTTINPPPVDNRLLEASHVGQFLTSNCTNWRTNLNWPGLDAPAPSAAWPPADGLVMMNLEGFTCQRIAYAGLERGPVMMVLEYSDNAKIPGQCSKSETTITSGVLYGWGVSDPDLAARLTARLGTPTYAIQLVGPSSEPMPFASLETVEWSANGETSKLAFTVAAETTPDTRFPNRLFWQNDTGIAAIEFSYEGLRPNFGDKPTQGQLAPPLKMAEAYPTYLSLGQLYPQMTATGRIMTWSDLECESPSGSSSL